jgi:leader peptidase (prepilin peptidase)/N-methyltransferase
VYIGALLGAVAFVGIVLPIEWVRSRRRGDPVELPLVPFGVFLAPGAIVTLLWGDRLIDWYLHGVMGL